MKYSLIIGKFQPFDDEDEAHVRELLKEKKNVCIAVQSTTKDRKNPYSIEQRMRMIQGRLTKEIFDRQVVVSIIPDIEGTVFVCKEGK